MATETHTIIVEARGEAEVERLNQKVTQQKSVLKALLDQQVSAKAAGRDFSQAINDSAGRIEVLTRLLNQAKSSLDAFRSSQIATTDAVALARADAAAALEITSRGRRGPNQPFGVPSGSLPPPVSGDSKQNVADLSSAFTTLTYAINDADQFNVSFTAGVRALGNQIPGLISGLQAVKTAGFAGVVSVLSGPQGVILGLTVLASLMPKIVAGWQKLEEAWGIGIPQPALDGPEKLAGALKKASTEMEELRSKTRLTAEEFGRLKELEKSIPGIRQKQKDLSETEALVNVQSKVTQDQADAFKKAIGTVGGGNALETVRFALEQQADEKGQAVNPLGGRGTPEEVAKNLLLEASRGDKNAAGQVARLAGPESNLGRAITENAPETKAAEEVATRIDRVSDTLSKALDKAKETIGKKADDLRDEDIALSRAIQEVEASDQKEREKKAKESTDREVQSASRLGLDKLALNATLAGLSPSEINEFLTKKLGVGFGAAGEITGQAGQAAQEQLLRQQLGLDQAPRRTSEISGDIAADIQRGIGGQDEQREQVELARAMKQSLQSIDQNTKRDFAGRPVISRKYF